MLEKIKSVAVQTKKFFSKKRTSIKRLNSKLQRESVTGLDVKIEKFLKKELKKIDKDAGFWGEETDKNIKNKNNFWLVDPIDSTNNYLLNIPFYSICIAYCNKNQAEMAVCFFPELDLLFYAQEGKGAFLNDKKIRVSNKSKIKESLLMYDNHFYKTKEMFKILEKIVNNFFTIRISGCASFDICMIAAGKAEARVFNKTKVMDFMPAGLILEEAGGKITNFKGVKIKLSDKQVVCTNGKIHSQLIKMINKRKR